MSTPKNPGPWLPDAPVRPPSNAPADSSPRERPEAPSVLERLKAAQPRTTSPTTDARQSGPEPEAAAAPTTRHAARSTPQVSTPGGGEGNAVRSATGESVGTDPRPAGDAAAERLRIAATRVRTAGSSTGRAIGRGSSAALRHAGSWDSDIVRQCAVTLCAVACILGSAAGVGAFGGPSIRDAAGGLFAPDATLLAPSSSAFSIWSVIYAGLIAYTAFQWLPSQRRSERQRRLGWTVAASMLLNLAWIMSAQAGLLTLSLVVIMLLFFALLAAVRTLNEHPNETRLEGALVDTPIGLYLGWVLVAAAANAAALLTAQGIDLLGWEGTTWAIVGIIAVLMTAAVVCSTDRGRLSVAAATSWGLLWIAVERVVGQPFAVGVAFLAALSIFLLLITAGSRRHRVDHAYRRRLRAEEDAQREPLDLLGESYEDSRY